MDEAGATAQRTFSVEEAESLLGELRERLARVREARQAVLANGQPIRDSAVGNGGGARGKAYWEALSTLRRDVEAMNAAGVVLRDPETGLVDFPARREGRDIFLCWRVGEDHVMFWHGTDTGFGSRRPL
jgi:hypothetical protein